MRRAPRTFIFSPVALTASNSSRFDELRLMNVPGSVAPAGMNMSDVTSTPASTRGPYMKATVALCHACLSLSGAVHSEGGKEKSTTSPSDHVRLRLRKAPGSTGGTPVGAPLMCADPGRWSQDGTRMFRMNVDVADGLVGGDPLALAFSPRPCVSTPPRVLGGETRTVIEPVSFGSVGK